MRKIHRQANAALPGCYDDGDDTFWLENFCLGYHGSELGWSACYRSDISEVEGDYSPTPKKALISLYEVMDAAPEGWIEPVDPEDLEDIVRGKKDLDVLIKSAKDRV